MSRLRLAVSFPSGTPADAQVPVLDDLAAALTATLGLRGQLRRSAGLSLPGGLAPAADGPLRVFIVEVPDGGSYADVLRALGGWYMRNPSLELGLKVDGPVGGASLQLRSFSTVAFAQAAGKVLELTAQEQQ